MKRPIVFLDLYCGAGGFSTGFAEVMKDLGLTFREAVETMRANHPGVYAMQMDIDAARRHDALARRKYVKPFKWFKFNRARRATAK